MRAVRSVCKLDPQPMSSISVCLHVFFSISLMQNQGKVDFIFSIESHPKFKTTYSRWDAHPVRTFRSIISRSYPPVKSVFVQAFHPKQRAFWSLPLNPPVKASCCHLRPIFINNPHHFSINIVHHFFHHFSIHFPDAFG